MPGPREQGAPGSAGYCGNETVSEAVKAQENPTERAIRKARPLTKEIIDRYKIKVCAARLQPVLVVFSSLRG